MYSLYTKWTRLLDIQYRKQIFFNHKLRPHKQSCPKKSTITFNLTYFSEKEFNLVFSFMVLQLKYRITIETYIFNSTMLYSIPVQYYLTILCTLSIVFGRHSHFLICTYLLHILRMLRFQQIYRNLFIKIHFSSFKSFLLSSLSFLLSSLSLRPTQV